MPKIAEEEAEPLQEEDEMQEEEEEEEGDEPMRMGEGLRDKTDNRTGRKARKRNESEPMNEVNDCTGFTVTNKAVTHTYVSASAQTGTG